MDVSSSSDRHLEDMEKFVVAEVDQATAMLSYARERSNTINISSTCLMRCLIRHRKGVDDFVKAQEKSRLPTC